MRQLNMTELSDHFGVTIKSELLTDTLGLPADGKAKRATLFNEDRLPEIGRKLAEHMLVCASTAPGAKAPKKVADDNSDLF